MICNHWKDNYRIDFHECLPIASDGWEYWFSNSSHPSTRKLWKSLELVEDVDEGLRNVTSAFFWGYAFVGPRSQLQYIVQSNFTDKQVKATQIDAEKLNRNIFFRSVGKRSALHIGDECLTIFGISFVFPQHSVYAKLFNEAIARFESVGFIDKMKEEIAWELQRGDASHLLEATKAKKFSFADVEERKLSLADTEGQ